MKLSFLNAIKNRRCSKAMYDKKDDTELLLAGWDGGKEMYLELSLGNVFGNSWGGRCLVILYTKRDIIFHPVALHMCWNYVEWVGTLLAPELWNSSEWASEGALLRNIIMKLKRNSMQIQVPYIGTPQIFSLNCILCTFMYISSIISNAKQLAKTFSKHVHQLRSKPVNILCKMNRNSFKFQAHNESGYCKLFLVPLI